MGPEITVLSKNIIVYHKMFSDPQKIIDGYIRHKEWGDWFIFGSQSSTGPELKAFESFPNKKEWDHLIESYLDSTYLKSPEGEPSSQELLRQCDQEVLSAFYLATSDYVSKVKASLPNWKLSPMTICMYESNRGVTKDYAMYYHTDYQPEYREAPGDKFGITATVYLNDDYEGGEILFRILDQDLTKIVEEIEYKPARGDVLVFPSEEPYYHGVKIVSSGQKFFVRSFWQYEFSGSEDWLINQKKYGPEVWDQMELERVRLERKQPKPWQLWDQV